MRSLFQTGAMIPPALVDDARRRPTQGGSCPSADTRVVLLRPISEWFCPRGLRRRWRGAASLHELRRNDDLGCLIDRSVGPGCGAVDGVVGEGAGVLTDG